MGSDSGVTAEHNGGTHMTFEDMGILRVVPTMKIYDVARSCTIWVTSKKLSGQRTCVY